MESDGEIEYLDEDADIVQQCVQPPLAMNTELQVLNSDDSFSHHTPLLVERNNSDRKRKRKDKTEEDDDSDYNPDEDIMPASPPSPPATKKKKTVTRKMTLYKPLVTMVKAEKKPPEQLALTRKQMDIRIPDYEDPLCLPVRAIRSIPSNIDRLKKWNDACIEHLKHSDNLFKPETGQTKSSTRSIVLKNMIHRESGRTETVIWSKTTVANKEGVKKSQLFQCILPKFREKTTLVPMKMLYEKKKKVYHKNEVVLTKEDHRDGDVLVVYNSQEALSAVYKFDDSGRDSEGTRSDRVLREVASCRVCAPCYQASWRGSKARSDKRSLVCPICQRAAISVYNLLRHVRAHSAHDVRKNKLAVSRALAEVVDYHYNCRICQKKMRSIKGLREHVLTHKGTTTFKCEVGNHITT